MIHPEPQFAVVVPLYNKAPHIRRCLESIQRQSFPFFEAIIVDDGSTDGSGEIAARFSDPRFRVIRQPNAGVGAARNRGIAESTAPFVAFLDADDAWDPDFLSAIATLTKRYPSAGIFVTGYRRIFSHGEHRETTIAHPDPDGTALISNYFAAVREANLVTSSSVAVPRRVFELTGRFLEGEPIGEDIDLWARIALRFPIACDHRILATYHSETEGRSFDLWRDRPPYPPVVRSLRRVLASSSLPTSTSRAVNDYVDSRLMAYAYWLLSLGKREQWLAFLRQESFATFRYRLEAAGLRRLAFLPPRVINAIRLKPENLWRRFRNMASKGDSAGRYMVTRVLVPVRSSPHPAIPNTKRSEASA